LAQIDDPADQRRIVRLLGTIEDIPDTDARSVARQQVTMDLLDNYLGRVGQTQQTGACEAFDALMNEYDYYMELGDRLGLEHTPPAYQNAFRNRLNAMRVHGCIPYEGPDNWPPDRTPLVDDEIVVGQQFSRTGVFRTDFGEMVLGVADGSYSQRNGQIVIDTIRGNTIEGTWLQNVSSEKCDDGGFRGRFVFTFNETGFSGKSGYCGEVPDRTWNGVRVAASGQQFSRTGVFSTDFGRMTLGERGGTYAERDGRVTVVSVDGNTVEGTWTQSTSNQKCVDNTYRGRFLFTFTAGGFSGKSGYCDETPNRVWNGIRAQAAPAAPSQPVASRPTAPPPPPPPPPPPAASPPALRPLPPLRDPEPSWNQGLYGKYREWAERLIAYRDAGKCMGRSGFWNGLQSMEVVLEIDIETARKNGSGYFRSASPVLDFFQGWRSAANSAGCRDGPR